MTNSEKVHLMSGTKEDQQKLFDYLIEKAALGEQDEADLPMLEFLKREFTKPESVIVSMEARISGQGGLT